MKKLLDLIKENKKKVIIGVIGLVVVIAIVLVVIFMGGSQEKKLKNYMTEIGSDFYENFYYQQIGSDDASREEFLKNFTTIGVKVNLDNLSRYSTDDNNKNERYAKMISEFINNKTKAECNKENTKAIFYPKEPYHQNDYNLEIVLDCGFKEE